MTSRETLCKWFDDNGIIYDVDDSNDGYVNIYVFSKGDGSDFFDNQSVKVKGYSEFHTIYSFNEEGSLRLMGAYE